MSFKLVAASGYFIFLHPGHIDYLNSSKKLGDILVVIINNDEQCKLKYGRVLIPQEQRQNIIKNLKCVDLTLISIDEDLSVSKTLEKVCPDIFTNGGDRSGHDTPEAIKEKEVCDKIGCKILFGIGGYDKIYSSSDLLRSL